MPIIVRPLVSKLKVATTGRPGAPRSRDRRLGLLDRGHGFDPEKIRAAARKRRRLLRECLARIGQTQGAERLEDLAGGADAAGDEHRVAGTVRLATGDGGRLLVELCDPIGGIVQFQAVTGAAEGVGQNDVRAGIHEVALELRDALGVRAVPKLRRIARLQPEIEQIAAGRAVREQPGPLRQQ